MVCAALFNMAVQPPAVCYSDVAGMFAGLFFTMEPFPALRVAPLRKDRENDPFVRQFSASAPPGRSGAFPAGACSPLVLIVGGRYGFSLEPGLLLGLQA